MKLPWKTKGITLTAPLTKEVDDVVEFIDKYLAPNGCNLIVMQVRYRYKFQLHPECWGYDPLSKDDVKKIVNVCKKNNIRLIPKMNLHGHQSGIHNEPTDGILHGHEQSIPDFPDALLRAYPFLDETPNDKTVFYSRSLCTTHPLTKQIIFDLIDELIEVFEADGFHVGLDEVFHLGLCPECSKYSTAQLFADWVNTLYNHLKEKNIEMFMWSDRLLNSQKTGYNKFNASRNGTDGAIDMIPKDIMLCDWHYYTRGNFPSVDVFGDAGFRMLITTMRVKDSALDFIKYATEHDQGHVDGLLFTTWFGSGELARCILYGAEGKWKYANEICETLRYLFEE